MNRDKKNLKTHFLLLLAVLFWGITPSLMKLSLLEIDVFNFNVLRLFVALTTSGLLLIIYGNWKKIERKDWLLFIVIGFFGFFVFQFCFPIGVKYTSASIASLLMATLPINVIIINLFSKSDRVTLRSFGGIVLSVGGIAVIILGTNGGLSLEGTYARGVLLLIVAEMGFAVYTVKAKALISKYSLFQVMFIVILFSFIPFIILSAKDFLSFPFRSVSLQAWSGVVFMGIFGTCIGNILWYYGIHHLGSTKTSIYANLPPVFGIGISFIFLGETLSILQILGGLIIMSGVILVNRKNA